MKRSFQILLRLFLVVGAGYTKDFPVAVQYTGRDSF